MSDDFFSTTTHASFIPEVWSKKIVLAREQKLVMANNVMRLDVDASFGDTIHLPNVANLAADDVSAAGALEGEAPTESISDVSINKWKGKLVRIPDNVMAQASKYGLWQIYAEKIGFCLGAAIEDDLLALYTGLSTNSAGTLGVDLNDAALRLAVQKLDIADVPMEDRYAIIYPTQKNALLGIDKFVRADSIGSGNAIRNGEFGQLYGVKFFVSSRVPTSAGERHNLMWHKDAFALAMQKDVKIEELARVQLARNLVGSEQYGVAEIRDDHACKLKS